MKIKLFQFHPHTLFSNGGGEAMFKNVLSELKNRNIDVSVFDIQSRNSEDFDLFHLFGSNNSVSEIYLPLSVANKKLVVSAIDYSNMSFVRLKLYKLFQKYYLFPNVYKYRQKLFSSAATVIANSYSEKKFLLNYFDLPQEKIIVIPVGVSSKFYKNKSDSFINKFSFNDYILCVGRINSRKAQIKTIKALSKLNIDLVFIGQSDPSEPDYFEEFQKIVKDTSHVHWIGQLAHDSDLLISAYSNALVHVLPSNPPEFPGIASMEAGLAGTKIVTTDAPVLRETFKNYAYYCNSEEESIYESVKKALDENINEDLSRYLYENFTWEKIISQYIDVYKVLGNTSGME